jgi:hypothetical protein
MKIREFVKIRKELGKTQKELSELLGISLKAVKSFEQGWRRIPVYIERQMLFIVVVKVDIGKRKIKCWNIMKCSSEQREKCPSWEFKVGRFCWMLNGTICKGRTQKNWQEKMRICRKCKVFKALYELK